MRQEIKALAKQQIKGKIGKLFVVSLITAVCGMVASFIPVVGSLISSLVLAPAFALACTMIYIKISENNDFEIKDVFNGFEFFWSAFKVQFLTGLFVMLWSLLFYIPGIIKAISYSMSMYIIAENPSMGARAAINESKEIMNGHKAEFFVLGLSFIGWMLLGMITFGIAFIWVFPYMQATMANFYQKVKKNNNYAAPAYNNIEA